MISLTSSRQLHCFFGDLPWLASVTDLKRPSSLFSSPAKVLRLSMRNRNFVILLEVKCLFATCKEMLLTDPWTNPPNPPIRLQYSRHLGSLAFGSWVLADSLHDYYTTWLEQGTMCRANEMADSTATAFH